LAVSCSVSDDGHDLRFHPGTSSLRSQIVISNPLRGHKVMLNSDLAALYQVEVRPLNQAVRRNIDRFPADFMFQLTAEETELLRSQTVTLKTGRGQHRKYSPLRLHGIGGDGARDS